MKTILKSIKILSVLFIGMAMVNCEEDDVILPEVVAHFTYTINQETGVVSFINTSENANVYHWDFGDDEESTEINPSHVYQPGTYEVVLSARNVASPFITFTDTITINGSNTGGGDCTEETTESIAAADLNITFQSNTPTFIEDNVTFSWIDNPDASGINTSCKVGQATRANNSAFDNLQIDLADKLDFSTVEGLKIKVWSPVANTPVLLKLEEIGNAGNFVEIQQSTTAANTWEELTFDFESTATPQFNKIVLFFNFNVADGSTYYFDDLMVYGTGGGGGGTCVPETAESIAAADLNITFQSNTPTFIQDNTTFAWIDNPDDSGSVNTSCKVGEATRANNSPFDNLQIDLADKLDFNAVEGLKIKIWSPVANTPVLLKLEEIGNAGNFVEILQNTTAANSWEELTFDFAPTATPQFNKIVLFFNFNVADGSTYYFDDLMVYGTGGGGGGTFDDGLLTNGDFESGSIDPWFGNAANLQEDGGNSFNFANVMAAGNPFDVNLSQVVEIEQGKNYTLTFDASSDGNRTLVAGIGLNENPWTAATEEVNLTTTTQTFELNLSSADFGSANSRVLFDMGAATGVVVIDNVSLFCDDCDTGTGTGGGGCAGDAVAATAFPINFESCESFLSTFNDVGSITTVLADNPSMSGINTSDYVLKVDKGSGTNRWAGFQNAFPSNFDATKTFKVKIYSTKANVVMRFEVNSDPQSPGSGNPGPQYATITQANTWTEVEIVFTGIPPSNTGLNQFVIKPDNPDGTDGEVTSTSETYYFDDIRLE